MQDTQIILFFKDDFVLYEDLVKQLILRNFGEVKINTLEQAFLI